MTTAAAHSEIATRFRVLIAGSRHWTDVTTVHDALAALHGEHGPLRLVHGGNHGADAIANRWGLLHDAAIEVHPSNWRTMGRHAGTLRNQHMVQDGADMCLAFIDDRSPGATHCADRAEATGIPTRRWYA